MSVPDNTQQNALAQVAASGAIPGFNPLTVALPTSAPDSGTDVFGLSKDLAQSRIFTGIVAGEHRQDVHIRGGSTAGTLQNGGSKISSVNAEDLMKLYRDRATSSNPADKQAWVETQQQLQAMNAYGDSKRINWGGWSPTDASALKYALEGYTSGGQSNFGTFEEYVKQQAAQGAANGLDKNLAPNGGNPALNQFAITDPQALQSSVQNAAHAAIGRSLTDEELQSFVSNFQGQQIANGKNTTDQVLTDPDQKSQAANFVKGNFGQEFANYQTQGYVNGILDMFLQGQSQRPNITVAADSPVLQ